MPRDVLHREMSCGGILSMVGNCWVMYQGYNRGLISDVMFASFLTLSRAVTSHNITVTFRWTNSVTVKALHWSHWKLPEVSLFILNDRSNARILVLYRHCVPLGWVSRATTSDISCPLETLLNAPYPWARYMAVLVPACHRATVPAGWHWFNQTPVSSNSYK